jgi:hypothetical protein
VVENALDVVDGLRREEDLGSEVAPLGERRRDWRKGFRRRKRGEVVDAMLCLVL